MKPPIPKNLMPNDQVTPAETAVILNLATSCLAIPGDFVELGCYRGDTSVLLGKMLQKSASVDEKAALASAKPVENLCKTSPKPWKNLWIYDSFAGLPAKTAEDRSGAGQNFQKGELLVSKREVVDKLRKHGLKTASHLDLEANPEAHSGSTTHHASTVIVKKAWFDDLQPADLPAEIAFAFLDGDLYDSIRTSLRLVVPCLASQGIIVVHDYNNPELPGSARAVDEFLRAHPRYQLTQNHTLAILTQKC